MAVFRWIAALALGFALIAFGVMKFAGPNPIFAYIEFRSGIGFAEPFGAWITGALEILAGLAIALPATRRTGLYLGGAVIGGAILTHLSPFLGIATPAGFTEGALPPWDGSDFLPAETGLFVVAIGLLGLLALNLWLEHRR